MEQGRRESTSWNEVFGPIVGPDRVLVGQDQREHYSRDIFFWAESSTADAVVRVHTVDELKAIVVAAREQQCFIYARGGGLSYSKGYVPSYQPSIVVDLQALNRVREVDREHGLLIADAGCTWQQITDALADTDFEVELTAPFSGIHSTVGGALSQNVPQGMHGILGVEVVRADGDLMRTGSWGSRAGSPFFPDLGPNLTSLFLGDCGAFGIKTGAALKLKQKARAVGYCSFAFETYESLARAMIPLSTMPFIHRPVGLDPFKSQNSIKVGFKEALQTVRAVADQDKGLKGMARGARFAAEGSRNFMEGVKWSLHLTIKGDSEPGIESGLAQVREACLPLGREIPNLLPQAMAARGYSVRGFLGANGERWVPSNGLFPVGRAPDVARAVQSFFNQRRQAMDEVGMWESYMTNFGHGYFLCEPSVYWQDEVSSLHLGYLSADEAARFKNLPANPKARALAQQIRIELRDFFDELGAAHVQFGKFYRLNEALDDPNWDTLQQIKQIFDPDCRLSPGNLGFTPEAIGT